MSRLFTYACLSLALGSLAGGTEPLAAKTPADTKAKPDDKKPRVDLYGDPLPLGAIARMGTVRLRHHDQIHWLAVSDDCRLAASAGGDWDHNPSQVIRLWDLQTGKEIMQFVGHTTVPDNLVFSPDGKLLASATTSRRSNRCSVLLWDVKSGEKVQEFKESVDLGGDKARGGVCCNVAFSPDGKILAYATGDPKIRLIDVARGKVVRDCTVNGAPRSILFFNDGTLLVTCADSISVWNPNGKRIMRMEWGENQGIPFFLADSGKTLLAAQMADDSAANQVIWWDLEKNVEMRRTPGSLLAWSRDGKLMAVRSPKQIQIWSITGRKQVRSFPARGYLGSYPGFYFSGALSADGNTLVAADWSTIRVLDTRTGKDLHDAPAHWAAVRYVGFAMEERDVISAGDRVVRLWSANTGTMSRLLDGHEMFITSASISADRKLLATGSWDGSVRVWDLVKKAQCFLLSIERHCSPLVAFSPNQKKLATKVLYGRTKETIQVWDTTTWKETRRFGEGNQGESLAFLPAGDVLVDTYGNSMAFYKCDKGERARTIGMKSHFPTTAVFSSDGRLAILGDPKCPPGRRPGAVTIVDMGSGTVIGELAGQQATVVSLAISSDGEVLVSGSTDGSIFIWDLLSGREMGRMAGHRGAVLALAISRDKKRLASACSDTTVLLWDLKSAIKGASRSDPDLSKEDTKKLWSDLVSADPALAYPAFCKWVNAGKQTVAFMTMRLANWDEAGRTAQQPILVLERIATTDAIALLRTLSERKETEVGRSAQGALSRLKQR